MGGATGVLDDQQRAVVHDDRFDDGAVLRVPRHRRFAPGLTLGVVASIVILGSIELLAIGLIHDVAEREALEQAASRTGESVRVAFEPLLTDELLEGEPDAWAALDDRGNALLAQTGFDHLKVWSADGVIVWSDEDELVGRSFDLEDEEVELLANPGVTAEVSDLSHEENQLEVVDADQLLEVYVGFRTPSGTPWLVESYSSYALVAERAAALQRAFVFPMTIVLVTLAAAEIALVWFVSRRLARAERHRMQMLQRAMHAADAERRRVAAEVHDGAVQDLAGIAFALAGAARSSEVDRAEIDQLADAMRHAVGDLRELLTKVYPADVPAGGWLAGVTDEIAALRAGGVAVRLEVDDDEMSPVEETLVMRTAREALRNIAKHASAGEVMLRLEISPREIALTVHDDGAGFDVAGRREGHFGLPIMRDLVTEAGGKFLVSSEVGHGATVSMRLARVR